LASIAVALPLATVAFTAVVALGATALSVVLAIPALWGLGVASRAMAVVARVRTVALGGPELVDPVPPLASPRPWGRFFERLRTRSRWREVLYHLVALPVTSVTFMVTFSVWAGSIALVFLPLYAGALPGGTAKFWAFEAGPGLGLALAVAGIVGVAVVAPWVTLSAADLEGRLTRGLIGQASDADLAARLRRAEVQRSAAVDSAEAERRRIERDLHDGAQQRLVALAAGLGAAREAMDDDPEAGRALVADAHEEAKAALKEIRDLVRGIHPVILEDRGLDAALSAVVARSPVPVALDVRAEPRPPAAVESATYFVVNEALVNVARHAQATRASVSIARAGDRLVIEVHDDGVGGADASLGTGLQGLRERVDGLGGDLRVISPVGGPTTISVELPCAS
ncbi:MAG: sensor histidine kinase, partial [Acidimicrobiales bacterium]|nr:sensor histidine kinase [Acidimicrobiales bacterium]